MSGGARKNAHAGGAAPPAADRGAAGFAALRTSAEWSARFGERRATLSVGNFDGLHLGHQQILRRVRERARERGAIAAVVTFDPHPMKFLHPEKAPLLVQTLEQRLAGFAAFGMDAALVLRFDAALAALPAREFVRGILAGQLHAADILVGENFRFGHRQQGSVALLREMSGACGFAVEIIEPVTVSGPQGREVASSTAVRRAVSEGRMGDAARLLGRAFALTGKIERGEGRGSKIVVPTLNLAPEQELLPKTGVYATETVVWATDAAGHGGERVFRSATNVGYRPTFVHQDDNRGQKKNDGPAEGKRLSIESHLFDFSETLSEGRLEVRFWERLRDEKKFAGPAELRGQIASDLERARAFFQGRQMAGSRR